MGYTTTAMPPSLNPARPLKATNTGKDGEKAEAIRNKPVQNKQIAYGHTRPYMSERYDR